MVEVSVFALLLLGGLPVGFVLGLVALINALKEGGIDFYVFPQQMFVGVNKFVLMSIPFFILAGELMNAGGLTRRIVAFALSVVGFVRGGLALSIVVAEVIFSGLTGSAQADAAALGSVMVPSMKKQGYDVDFSAALVSASAVLGPVIPPSIMMVVYGAAGEVSLGALFAAGFVPGFVCGGFLLLMTYGYALRRGYPKGEPFALAHVGRVLGESALAVFAPILVLGGIWAGVFTPTEAAAVAVGYAFITGYWIYRELDLRAVPRILRDTAVLTSSVMFVMATASVFAWLLTYQRVPQLAAQFALETLKSPQTFFLVVNVLLLFIGSWMDPIATVIVLTPILLPVAVGLGVHPVHLGVVVVYNLSIGLAHPPMGYILYIMSAIAGISVERLTKSIWPFLLLHVAVLALITYFPRIVMILPHAFGYR
jgi:C4-dicarboxylate transporter, DctM subunit